MFVSKIHVILYRIGALVNSVTICCQRAAAEIRDYYSLLSLGCSHCAGERLVIVYFLQGVPGFKVEFYFHSTNLPTFLALQGVWAWKLNFIFILQFYQHFWLYKGSGLRN